MDWPRISRKTFGSEWFGVVVDGGRVKTASRCALAGASRPLEDFILNHGAKSFKSRSTTGMPGLWGFSGLGFKTGQPLPDGLTIGCGFVHIKQGLGFRNLLRRLHSGRALQRRCCNGQFRQHRCLLMLLLLPTATTCTGTSTTTTMSTTTTATTIAATSAATKPSLSSSTAVVMMVRVLLVLFWALDVLVTVVAVAVLE